MRKLFTIFTLILLPACLHAGDGVSMGILMSPKGVGVTTIFPARDGSQSVCRMYADFEKVMKGESGRPGAMLQYIFDYPIVYKRLNDGGTMTWYIGPGVAAGYVRDRKTGYGMTAGLAGETCLEFSFARLFNIRLGLSGALALHAEKEKRNGSHTLRFYRNGILNAWKPELSLAYRF